MTSRSWTVAMSTEPLGINLKTCPHQSGQGEMVIAQHVKGRNENRRFITLRA